MLSGPGEWRGGLAQAPENGILATTLPVECGVNRVMVRSTTAAGTIVLRASADGLKPATATVQAHSVNAANGLEREAADDTLASNLSRGPAPAPEALQITRTTVEPTRITTGSNSDEAANVYDDNEATAWTSANQLSDAWVQFDFPAPTRVNEIVLRLGSWRTTSYPLRVFADGKEVFAGVAPSTVGYSTLRFPVATCRNLRIQLAGVPRGGGNATLIEVTGKADANGGDDAKARGKLVIHEVELLHSRTDSIAANAQ
jgi:hypothetical protein